MRPLKRSCTFCCDRGSVLLSFLSLMDLTDADGCCGKEGQSRNLKAVGVSAPRDGSLWSVSWVDTVQKRPRAE